MRWLILCLLSFSCVGAATIHGSVYDFGLDKTSAVVRINTTPVQKMVAVDGEYEFVVPSGSYELIAETQDAEIEELIVVEEDGSYVLDLILLPVFEEVDDIDVEVPVEEQGVSNVGIWIGAGIGMVVLIFAVLFWKRPKKQQQEERNEVLDIVVKEGRILQKDLRKKLPYSEAKVSLMISELEAQGKIKRIKKGRGNILSKV